MRAHTDYLWFETRKRKELVNITDRVAQIVAASGVRDGFCLVSAMHITAAIWVNDEESGLKQDVMEWLHAFGVHLMKLVNVLKDPRESLRHGFQLVLRKPKPGQLRSPAYILFSNRHFPIQIPRYRDPL